MSTKLDFQHRAMDRVAQLTTRFNAIDTNANGTLDKSELSAVFGDIQAPPRRSLSHLAVRLLLPLSPPLCPMPVASLTQGL